jgi:hypothetical protein
MSSHRLKLLFRTKKIGKKIMSGCLLLLIPLCRAGLGFFLFLNLSYLGCRKNWLDYNDKCYFAFSNPTTFQGAVDQCKSTKEGAQLYEPHDGEEGNYISKYLKDYFGEQDILGQCVWIGINDKDKEGR